MKLINFFNNFIVFIKQAVYITCISVIIALVVNSIRPDGLPLIKKPEDQKKNNETSGFKLISIEDAIKMHNRKDVIFVDARSVEDYNYCHIQGAINLPDHNFDSNIDSFLSKVTFDIKIITYCEGVECPLAYHLAEKLFFFGYENVYYFNAGIEAWQNQSLPVDKNEN